MVKSLSQNQMSKLFFQNITGMVKCRQIVNFEEMDTEWSRGKNYGFWVLWRIFKEYLKQNIIMAVLRKQILIQLSFADWLNKINTAKDDPRRKTDSNFGFSQAA